MSFFDLDKVWNHIARTWSDSDSRLTQQSFEADLRQHLIS